MFSTIPTRVYNNNCAKSTKSYDSEIKVKKVKLK